MTTGPRSSSAGARERATGSTWSLPKGTPDKDESTEQTALREVTEETGLQVRIIAPVGPIEYFFTQRGRRIHKTVHYFLMEATGGDMADHDHEFDEVAWVPIAEARALMSFQTERDIVERAHCAKLPTAHRRPAPPGADQLSAARRR